MPEKRVTRTNDTRTRRARPMQRRPAWPWIVAGVLVTGLIAAVAVFLAGRGAGQPTSVQRFALQGQQHIASGEAHPAYNSDPPTSGWHYDAPLSSGFHEQPAEDEQVVHNLEHGHVVISYDCSKLADCQSTKDQLRQLAERYRRELIP